MIFPVYVKFLFSEISRFENVRLCPIVSISHRLYPLKIIFYLPLSLVSDLLVRVPSTDLGLVLQPPYTDGPKVLTTVYLYIKTEGRVEILIYK